MKHCQEKRLLPPSLPDPSIPLVKLADALDARLRETGNIDDNDSEEAIALFQEAYLLNPPQTEQSGLLNRLANAHRLRFTQTLLTLTRRFPYIQRRYGYNHPPIQSVQLTEQPRQYAFSPIQLDNKI